MLDLVIANGMVVFPAQSIQSVNIGVRQGKIAGFFDADTTPPAARVIDARGLYVFPGGVDPHVHLGIYNPYLRDFEVDTRIAALGGYTTIVNYYRHAESYLGTIMHMVEEAEQVSTIDFAFSLGLLRKAHWDEFEAVVRETGVTSWKFYRQYEDEIGRRFNVDDPLSLNDYDLLVTLQRFAELSDKLLVCVHCEDMAIARGKTAELRARGSWQHTLAEFAETSPGYAEALSVLSALYLAKIANSRNLYIVHLSSGYSVDLLERLSWLQEETGTVVETTPHYLNLTKHAPVGLLAKVGPPVQDDWDRQRLWEGIEAGIITCYGGDHIPCPLEKKGGRDLWTTALGFGGIGVQLALLLSEGYHKRRIPLEHIAYLMSTGPAKSFGLYPKKGALEIGADADFTLVDLELERTVSADMPEVGDGYSVYEGMTLKGWPVQTILRGTVIAANRRVIVDSGYGQYLRREI
jgi:dihydroorotase-like cyclic amidohydrolase